MGIPLEAVCACCFVPRNEWRPQLCFREKLKKMLQRIVPLINTITEDTTTKSSINSPLLNVTEEEEGKPQRLRSYSSSSSGSSCNKDHSTIEDSRSKPYNQTRKHAYSYTYNKSSYSNTNYHFDNSYSPSASDLSLARTIQNCIRFNKPLQVALVFAGNDIFFAEDRYRAWEKHTWINFKDQSDILTCTYCVVIFIVRASFKGVKGASTTF